MKLESLSPNLISRDVNASVDYYVRKLGFTLIASVPETGTFGWAMLQRDNVSFMFQSLDSLKDDLPALDLSKPGSPGTFFIKMKGIDDLYQQFRSSADVVVGMRTTFYGMKEFVIQDPDGYYLMFAEEK